MSLNEIIDFFCCIRRKVTMKSNNIEAEKGCVVFYVTSFHFKTVENLKTKFEK